MAKVRKGPSPKVAQVYCKADAARAPMTAKSPLCEFGFPAACALSVGNAAVARILVLPRGGKTGYSRRAQQGSAVEFTHCGTKPPFADKSVDIFCAKCVSAGLCARETAASFAQKYELWILK